MVSGDDSEVHTHPYLATGWRRQGCPLKIPAAGADHKFTVFGAVDDASGQVIWHTSGCKDETAFAAFLDHLAQTLPQGEPAVVVLDNASYHKSHALRAHWQRLSERLQPFFLPAYAPQLNLIERLWRYLKDKLACHRWWNDRDPAGRARGPFPCRRWTELSTSPQLMPTRLELRKWGCSGKVQHARWIMLAQL